MAILNTQINYGILYSMINWLIWNRLWSLVPYRRLGRGQNRVKKIVKRFSMASFSAINFTSLNRYLIDINHNYVSCFIEFLARRRRTTETGMQRLFFNGNESFILVHKKTINLSPGKAFEMHFLISQTAFSHRLSLTSELNVLHKSSYGEWKKAILSEMAFQNILNCMTLHNFRPLFVSVWATTAITMEQLKADWEAKPLKLCSAMQPHRCKQCLCRCCENFEWPNEWNFDDIKHENGPLVMGYDETLSGQMYETVNFYIQIERIHSWSAHGWHELLILWWGWTFSILPSSVPQSHTFRAVSRCC